MFVSIASWGQDVTYLSLHHMPPAHQGLGQRSKVVILPTHFAHLWWRGDWQRDLLSEILGSSLIKSELLFAPSLCTKTPLLGSLLHLVCCCVVTVMGRCCYYSCGCMLLRVHQYVEDLTQYDVINTTGENGLTLLWQYICTECVLKTKVNWFLSARRVLCTLYTQPSHVLEWWRKRGVGSLRRGMPTRELNIQFWFFDNNRI